MTQNIYGAINNKENLVRYVTPFGDKVLGQEEINI